MDTPDPIDAAVRRIRALDLAAVALAVLGVVAAAVLWSNATGYDEPDPARALTVGALLWVAAAVLVGASAVSKTILDAGPDVESGPAEPHRGQ